MRIRFLRSMTLLSLLALLLSACANKEERYEAGDGAGYDSYEDAPLDVSASSGRGSARKTARAEAPGTTAKMTADGSAAPSSSTVVVTSGRVAASAGGIGVRGSGASIRVDGVAVTDAAAAPVMMSAPASFASGLSGGEAVLRDDFVDAVTTTAAWEETVAGDVAITGALKLEGMDVDAAKTTAVIVEDLEAADDEKAKIVETEEEKPKNAVPRPGQLTAGEWSDLREWKFWNSVTASNDWKHMDGYWGFGEGERISVRVDNGRDPIPDAVAKLLDKNGTLLWTARTDNFGRAELFTGLEKKDGEAPYQIVVTSGGKEARMPGIDPSREQSPSESPLIVRLAGPVPELKVVDLMFVVDATGSMGDELNYIKSELQSVIDRVRAEMGEEFVIRLSTGVYRDQGDDYVVRSHEFDEKIDAAAEFLRNQSAGGGGDTPEAVEEALEDAVRKHAWSDQAQSRFLFFVLDAPPHYTDDRVAKLRELTREAASKGIRIIGVSGSGVDKETEFLMRNMGLHTGGTYVFLTDHSGIGGSHIEPTIGSYTVEYLDDLIVRLIVQYTQRPASLDAIVDRKPTLD